MKPIRHCVLALALAAAPLAAASAAETQLYETGPSEDASFLRFVNATATPVTVVPDNRQTRIVLDAARPATDFLPVKANSAIAGAIEQGSARAAVSVRVAPGAFATVAVLPDGKDGIKTVTVAEQPDDFNGLKASLAFYSLDPSCAHAGLQAAGRGIAIVDDVATGTLKRRAINPVALSVQAACAGQPAGAPLDLGQLQAGKRYSVLAIPGSSGTRLIRVDDTLAR
ncbi:alginate O-acetyltransferase AlgF [Bordetella genomosp. 11]|uniref:alginate O-acetyltransferase AlgF n=1 Tax=Bordetella genomosp. 11 TaxID=1416808 RepID=UPI000B9ED0AD|nr:alginate O-acetyltransferase AlgF [Bordetella genomosp. 11]